MHREVGGNDRQPRRHSLHQRVCEGFRVSSSHEQVARLIDIMEAFVWYRAEFNNLLLDAELANHFRGKIRIVGAGRVLFAYQDEGARAAWRELRSSQEDQALWAAIEREAESIRGMGFYLSPSAYVDAVTDIAAPVTVGDSAPAVAALVMPFIGGRSAKISLTQAATATRAAAQRISHELR